MMLSIYPEQALTLLQSSPEVAYLISLSNAENLLAVLFDLEGT